MRIASLFFILFLSFEASAALSIVVQSTDPSTGRVVLNGAFNKPSRSGPFFDWGDGSSNQGFFPQTHTYANKSQNYVIRAYITYDDGTQENTYTGAYFIQQNFNVNGAHVSFQGFPNDYFLGAKPAISPQEFVRLVDIQFEILRSAHTNYDGQRIVFSYGGACGGAYSVASAHVVVMCDGFKIANIQDQVLPWSVFAHEMSHNMFGNSDRFLYSFMSIYSAYLDEHQAEVMPEFVQQTMRSNAIAYGISPEIINAMTSGFNKVDYSGMYNQYISSGKPFSILQGNTSAATITGQATAQMILNLYKQSGDVSKIKNFAAFLQDRFTVLAFSNQFPDPSQLSNYVVAAWSAAFGTDLRSSFRGLNYPVDDFLYNKYINIIAPDGITSDCIVAYTGLNDKVGLSNGDPRFVCLNKRWYDCGWEGNDPSWETKAANGQTVGSWTCNLTTRQWFKRDPNSKGLTDISVYRPANGTWYVAGVGNYQWGASTDIPVAADYDGDRKTDIAVFRPSTGYWYILKSSTSFVGADTYIFGGLGDIPVMGDYSGHGKADVAVYRPSSGTWYIAGVGSYQWGAPTDIPVAADYDGDGKTDIAVFRPSTGYWYILKSSTSFAGADTYTFGGLGDIPVMGDYNGDGKADIAVFRPSNGTWYIAGVGIYQWGATTDVPMAADYDGDGKTDIAVFRPSTGYWYVLSSSSNYTSFFQYQWGTVGDIPIAADF